jgi:aminopeptidase
MNDPRIKKLADLLVNYSIGVKSGEKVVVSAPVQAEPLIKEIYKKVLLAGGYPLLIVSIADEEEMFFRYASDDQLRFIHEPSKMIMETYDARIAIIAAANTKALSHVDADKMVIRSQATRELSQTFMDRSATGTLKWTVSLFPTQAHAQDAEMSLGDYEDFVYRACLPDLADPIGYWKTFSARQQKVVDWLKGKHDVHLTAPGTDLHLSITGRIFENCDGKKNMPDGEVFTGPVENSVNGQVYFSYPAIYSGREVSGVRLWFENGRVVKASAEKNEEFLLKTLDTDTGARSVGEFAIGTNESIDRFTGEILFDEKIGGSFHMALGAGYPETGSQNESAIHWDMICDLRHDGEIYVDDLLLSKDGHFTLE